MARKMGVALQVTHNPRSKCSAAKMSTQSSSRPKDAQQLQVAYLAPAVSYIGALKLVSRNRPDVKVATATSTHLRIS